MANLEISFDASKLTKALDALPAKMQKKHLRAGLKAGAKPILQRMQEKCPVEHESPGPSSTALGPGVLKASLRVKVVNTKTGPAALIGAPEATAYVANFVEKGFDHTGHKRIKRGRGRQLPPGAKVKHIPGTYYMQGAVDEMKQQAVDAMVEAIAESMGSEDK